MYNIEKKEYGFKLVFGDFIRADEMQKWVDESKQVLSNVTGPFKIFVDMRTLKALPEESKVLMVEGQKMYKGAGMEKSVVILNDPTTTLQFKSIAKNTGIYDWERYIDASSNENWESVGLAWLKDGVDPDK